MTDDVRTYVLSTHRETVAAVQECADAVSAHWEGRDATGVEEPGATDGRAVAAALERELRRAGVLGTFPDLLAGAVAAAGYDLPATPVPAPPYVTVASVGPILRATISGGRLVIAVEVFAIERGEEVRYVRRPRPPGDALVVEWR